MTATVDKKAVLLLQRWPHECLSSLFTESD